VSEKLAQLPDGCWVTAKRECELCDKVTSILELEWHTVHNHPFYMVCPKCLRSMEKWKPLPGARKDDSPDAVSVKLNKPKRTRSISLADLHGQRQKQPEPFTFELDTSLSLDDLEEPE